MKLVTDGTNWAVTLKFLWFKWWFSAQGWLQTPRDEAWTDKETAEKWLRRLKA